MRKKLQNQGFTLIELLVVITIIAILASISVPVYNTVTERAKITKDLSNVKQIVLAARIYAGDNDGLFPGGGGDPAAVPPVAGTSTAAFNELIPEYVNLEKIFYTPQGAKTVPDENNDLTQAENCFSYVTGLTDSSPGNTPLIADFFTAGAGAYDNTHVWWNSAKAVVGRCDGSAKPEKIDTTAGTVRAADGTSDLFGALPATGEGDAGLIPTTAEVVDP